MDFTDSVSGPDQAEAHRQFLQFLRGLRELDAALGRWRPDYGRLPAAQTADQTPTTEAAVIAAHRRYSEGLRYLADHPEATQSLGGPAADDVAAALADAHIRFGAPAAPLEWFVPGAASPAPPTPPTPPAPSAPPAPPAPPEPPPLMEAAGAGGAEADLPVAVAGGRIAQSPWEVERAAAGRGTERTPPGRRGPPVSGRRDRGEDEPPPRGSGRGFAIAMGLGALVIGVIIVVALVLGARLAFGPGPTAAATTPTVAPATLPASDLPTGSALNVLAPATDCSALPTGQVPAALALSSPASGLGADPEASGYTNPYVSVHTGSAVGSSTRAFSLVVAVLPYQATPPASGTPINRAGTVQLVAYWDGTAWHGALRSWSGSAWTFPTGAGSEVDVAQAGTQVTVFWQGLVSGDKYGLILATSTGCAGLELTSAYVPEETYGSESSP